MAENNKTTETVIERFSPVPTLSVSGWVKDPSRKIDTIFYHYLTTQYHQTTMSLGSAYSLQYTTKENYSDPARLAERIQSDLTDLLSPYFDHVAVDVTYKKRDETFVYDFYIDMDIIHREFRWTSFKQLLIKESKAEQIVNINNEGRVALI
nr:MAG TPA: hypothetical protein [Caudoviricetes sp.]